MFNILNLALIVLFTVPPIFQLIFGSKATNPSYTIKFWKICLISIAGLIVATSMNLFLMTKAIQHSGSRDGLPIITILILEAFIGSLMIIMILIQFLIMRKRKQTI